MLVPRELDFETCQDWRRALDELAVSIDAVTARHCRVLGCSEPW
jgi:hypothetical protein